MSDKMKPNTLAVGDSPWAWLERFSGNWNQFGFTKAWSKLFSAWAYDAASFGRKSWSYCWWCSSRVARMKLVNLRQEICSACEIKRTNKDGVGYCGGCKCGVPGDVSAWKRVPVLISVRIVIWILMALLVLVRMIFGGVIALFRVRDPSLDNQLLRNGYNCPMGKHPGSHRTMLRLPDSARENKTTVAAPVALVGGAGI